MNAPRDNAGSDTRRCPICGKPSHADYQPFCSRRCADIDLHRWLQGGYAIPATEPPDEVEDGADEGRAKPPKSDDPER